MNSDSRLRILNVEDDKINSMVVKKFISADYDCDNAFSGQEAIEKAKNNKYDLFLMDISLGDPEYDGIRTMKEIREINGYEEGIFIAVTSFAMQGDKQSLIGQGFNDYLSKPIYKEQLLAVIKRNLS
jgi:CheY-like chemotaxis protein